MKNPIGLLFVIIVAFPSFLFAQERFSRADVIADLDTLCKNIREVHPNMFTVISSQEFEKRLEEIKASLPDSLTKLGFFKVAAPLLSSVGDGHTTCLTFPMEEFFKIDPFLLLVPIAIDKRDLSLKVTKEGELPMGAEILSINGIPSAELIRQMLTYASGESIFFKLIQLNRFLQGYLSFIDDAKMFDIKYRHKDSIATAHIDAVKFTEALSRSRSANSQEVKKQDPGTKQSTFTYSLLKEPDAALFAFDEFAFEEGYLNRFLDSMFRDIAGRNIPNLIIDIRKNIGGNSSVGDEILQYIVHTPFKQYGRALYKVSDQVKTKYPYYKGWDNGIYGDSSDSTQLTRLKDIPVRFNGNVYLLTSNSSFSSASGFAWAFQFFKVGTIVGEQTGGYIVSFGDMLPMTLPRTHFAYGVSWKEFYGYGATEAHRHGVMPDIEVPAERALDKVLEVISSSK